MNAPAKLRASCTKPAAIAVLGGVLGLAWYGALLIPDQTHIILVENNPAPRMFLLLVLASIVGTAVLWQLVRRARGWEKVCLGLMTPPWGACTYAALVLLLELTLGERTPWNDPPGSYSGWIGVSRLFLFFAWLAYTASFWIAMPMGLVHVAILSWLASFREAAPEPKPR